MNLSRDRNNRMSSRPVESSLNADLSSGFIFVYSAVFLMSLNGLFAKVIPLDATTITALRSFIAVAGLGLFGLVRSRRYRLSSMTHLVGVYGLGVLLGVHWVTFFHSMQVSTVAVGMLSLFSFPILTILVEPLFSRDRLAGGDIVAGILVLAGLGVMVSQDLADLHGPILSGVFWGVGSAFLFATRNLVQKYFFQDVTSDTLLFHQGIAIAVMLLPFLNVRQAAVLPLTGIVNLLLLGILCTAGAHTFYAASLKRLPAKSVALIGCLQPVLATLFAWLVIQETPQPNVLFGGAIILGVAAYESARKRSRPLVRR